MFTSNVATIDTANRTDNRSEFVAMLAVMRDDQIKAVARIRFGARPATKSRKQLTALLLDLFDATDSFTGK